MQYSNFEDQLKQSWNEHAPQLNTEDIWENIEPRLKKKKKRRFLLIWFFGGVGLLALLTWPMLRNEKPVEKPYSLHQNTQQVNSQKHSNSIARTNEHTATNYVSENTNTTTQEEQATDKKSISSATVSSASNKTINHIGRAHNIDNTLEPRPTISKTSHQKAHSTNLIEEKTSKNDVPIAHEKPSINNTKNVTEQSKDKPIVDKTTISNAENKSTTEQLKSKQKNNTDAAEKKKKSSPIKKKKQKKSAFEIAIIPSISPIYAHQQLKQKSSSDNQYKQRRQDLEESLEAFEISLLSQVNRRNSPWFVTGGINYRRINTRFVHQETITSSDTIVGDIAVVENALGEIIETERGLKVVSKTERINRKFHNRYNFINIPIGIGRHFDYKKMRISAAVGLQYNLLFRFKGSLYRENDDLVTLNNAQDNSYDRIFKKKSGMNLWVSTGIQKKVFKNTLLSISPRVQFPLSSISASAYALDESFLLFGLDVGLICPIDVNPKNRKKHRQ